MPRSLVKLLIKYFCILVSPVLILAILGYVSIFVARKHATEQMDRLAETSLLQIERVSDQLLEEVQATAVAFGTAARVLKVLQSEMEDPVTDLRGLRELVLVRNLVNTSAHARPIIRSIYIYIEGFESVLTTDSDIVWLRDMLDRSWLPIYHQQPADTLSWVARRNYTPLGESGPTESVISVYQRLFTLASGGLSGVVVLNLREQEAQKMLREVVLTDDHRFVVFDSDEELIVSNVENRAVVAALRRALRSGQSRLTSGDRTYIVNSKGSVRNGWQYAMLTPQEAYYAPVTGMVRLNIIIVTIAVMLGLAVAAVMARRSYRYIREVVDVIERSEAGLELPTTQGHATTGFSYITYHVLRAFVERQYYQLQLSERSYRQKTLELLALQSQMNPHFLFNTLEALNWQIVSETGKPGPANEMIGSLAKILKYALRSPMTFVMLREEVDNIKHYLRIQSLRKQNAYDMELSCPPELEDASMVPMTLQPLVENAIVHGFKEWPNGRIELTVAEQMGRLQIRLSDDGHGMDSSRLEKLRDEIAKPIEPGGERIGLVNTVRRLRLAFDGEVRVAIDSPPTEGFTVELLIPYRPLRREE